MNQKRIELFKNYMKVYDRLSNEEVFRENFDPKEEEMDELPQSDLFNENEDKSLLFQDLGEIVNSIDKEKLKPLFQRIEEVAVEKDILKKVPKDDKLLKTLMDVTKKDYDVKEYEKDILFFYVVKNDILSKALLMSDRVLGLFQVLNDIYSEDISEGNIALDKFTKKLETLRDTFKTEEYDKINSDDFMSIMGMELSEVEKLIENPLFYERSNEFGDKPIYEGQGEGAYVRLQNDMKKEKEGVEEGMKEAKKGNWKLKQEEKTQ